MEEAFKIHDALKGKTPLAIIHHSCASAAMLVIFAADKILIDRLATIVLHPAVTSVTGNSTAMLSASVALDVATEQIFRGGGQADWPAVRRCENLVFTGRR